MQNDDTVESGVAEVLNKIDNLNPSERRIIYRDNRYKLAYFVQKNEAAVLGDRFIAGLRTKWPDQSFVYTSGSRSVVDSRAIGSFVIRFTVRDVLLEFESVESQAGHHGFEFAVFYTCTRQTDLQLPAVWGGSAGAPVAKRTPGIVEYVFPCFW